MKIMYKPIGEITEQELNELIENQVAENQYIDYKACPFEDNKEFLYDVSAFANANGGMIFIGVEEELDREGKNTGIPEALNGINDNIDQLKLKYENLIRDGTQARIIGIQMGTVPLENGKKVFIIKVPNSLNSPHMVTIQGGQRFYIRNSAGKHRMDISEIRNCFLSGAEQEKRINNFITERLAKVKGNCGSIKLMNNPHYVVLHIIPFSAHFDYNKIEPNILATVVSNLPPITITGGWDNRFNLQGFLTYTEFARLPLPHGYVQIFRTGAIESVDNYLIRYNEERGQIPSTKLENNLIERIKSYLHAIHLIGLTPPLVISVSILGVSDFQLLTNPSFYGTSNTEGLIEEDDLILPEVIITELPESDSDLHLCLKPIFDGLWNAAGFPRSLNYDENGNWGPQSS